MLWARCLRLEDYERDSTLVVSELVVAGGYYARLPEIGLHHVSSKAALYFRSGPGCTSRRPQRNESADAWGVAENGGGSVR